MLAPGPCIMRIGMRCLDQMGNITCIAIAVASDVYEIYQSDYKMRTIYKKAEFWTGFAYGASQAAVTYPGVAADATGWGLIGHAAWTIGGGLIGGFIGDKTMEITYDFLFTKGVSGK